MAALAGRLSMLGENGHRVLAASLVYISRLPTGALKCLRGNLKVLFFKSCLPRSTLTLNTTVTTLVSVELEIHGDTPSTRDDNRGDSKCH